MDDRELAIACTHLSVAIKQCDPRRLDSVIDELSMSPWSHEFLQALKTVRHALEIEKHATRNKSSKRR
jgi:hypothetical protein